MRKLIVTTLSVCLIFPFLYAQNEKNEAFKDKVIYLDLGGGSLFYSINFEKQTKSGFVYGFGMEYLPNLTINDSYYGSTFGIIPTANQLFGKKSHHLEVGISGLLTLQGYQISGLKSLLAFGRIGYRYQPNNGGFVFRAGFTPILYPTIAPWGGISFGYCF